VIKTSDEGAVHYNAAQLSAARPGARRSSSPSNLLRGKVGREREAIGKEFTARLKARVTAAKGWDSPGTPTSIMNPSLGSTSASPSPPGHAAGVEVRDLATLRRDAFDLAQPKVSAEIDLEISSEPQVLRGESLPPPDRRRRPSLYSPTAKLQYMS